MSTPLKIGAIHLEEAKFSHVGDYLGRDPQLTPSAGNANVQVEVVRGKEADRVAVRLRFNSVPENPDYSFAISYVIILQMEGIAKPEMERAIAITGATMLYPYVRELLNNLSGRARFGQVVAHPVNFNAVIPEKGTTEVVAKPSRRKGKT